MPITTTLSKGYQITIPSAMRKALDLKAGDPIEITNTNNTITLTKAETQEENVRRVLRELDEIRTRHKAHMTAEQRAFAEKTRGWTANQFREYLDNTPEHKAYIKEKYGV